MKILVVSQYYFPEPFRINEICEKFVSRGHKVTVITGIPNYPDGIVYPGYQNENNREIINGVEVYRCAMRPRYQGNLNLARNYISFVKSTIEFINGKTIDLKSYDVIYAYQLSPVTSMIPAIKIKKKYGIPLFLYCLDMWPESLRNTPLEKEPFFSVLKWMSRKIYCSADRLVVTSPSFVKYLNDLCGKNESSIPFIPQHANPVPINVEYDESLAHYNQFTNFVFMGNVGDAQNVECVVRAVANVKDRSRVRIHIVGSGSHLDLCKQLAEKLGVMDTVLFHGRHPKAEMPKYYALADVCLVTLSDQGIVGYTIPGKLQEYMSAGKAILGCLDGDAAYVIKDAECGYCVPTNDDKALADMFVKMSADKGKMREFGNKAKQYYDKHFSLDQHVNAIEELMGELVK